MTRPGESTRPDPADAGGGRSYRGVLLRVLGVQVATLLVLWLLQARYGG